MSGIDLSGRWTGVYFYPVDPQWNPDDALPPTPFSALLLDAGGLVTRTTIEPDLFSGEGAPDIRATLEGHHDGSTLFFTKFPDGWQTHTIDYHGTVDAGGDSISGDWIIHGEWSGLFRMQRSVAASVRAATLTAAA